MPKELQLNSTLRLFLSVDIVGSTAFKQGKAAAQVLQGTESLDRPAEPWFSPIVQFYREIERSFSLEWQRYKNHIGPKNGWPPGANPEFWKGAGDELIYTKVLSDHREALACLQAWIRAVNDYRLHFKRSYPNLDLKSSAWLAGFPVHNAEVFFRSSVAGSETSDDDPIYSNLALHQTFYAKDEKEIIRDFIGPSIDTGFRLSGLATPRKLVVSVDLALLLVHATRIQQRDFGYPQVKFHYDGRVPLKGVFGGAPYPVFWIDMAADNDLNVAEDRLAHTEAADSDRVMEFCELFIAQHASFFFRPYITKNPDPYFTLMPDHHSDRLKKLQAYWESESERRQAEMDAEREVGEGATSVPDVDNLLGTSKTPQDTDASNQDKDKAEQK